MKCGWVQEQLLLYLAGELRPAENARLLKHLEKCAACTALAEELVETQEQVERVLPTNIEAPATLDARVMEAVRALPPRRLSWDRLFPQWGWRSQLALTSAGLCLLMIGFFAGKWQATQHQSINTMTATLDLALLESADQQSPVEMPYSEPRRLSQSLTSLMRFSVRAVDLVPEGARLVGGSKSTVQGIPVAILRYEYNGERITLFQMDAAKLSPPALQEVIFRSESYLAGKMHGFSYVAWRSGKTNCVMVAQRVPMHNLFRLACHACEKQDIL